MSLLATRNAVLAIALIAMATSCGPDSIATPPATTPGPLIPSDWYMHEANGSALPTAIADRFIGISPEQTMLDSAILTIRADNTYREVYWLRILISGQLDRSDFVADEGTIAVSGTAYLFTSTTRSRSISVTVPSLETVLTVEPMVFFNGAPLTYGTYKLTRP
jgi:hypothetical protein